MRDIAIIGGGINGCGIARDAAGRGLTVLLAEQSDLASGTSSASTKLIHGGLRYLEHYAFRLVRESLREREVLLRIAPHVVHPLRFILPHHAGLRSPHLIRLGLFLYDHIGGRRTLPGSRAIDLSRAQEGRSLKPGFTRGFAYSDCWVDDARLVVLNAMDARARGAEIRVRTEVVAAARGNGHWRITLRDSLSGDLDTVEARALVNASGAWLSDTAHRIKAETVPRVRLVRGSHIVVPKLFDHDNAYIFQNADRRIVFAIPYERAFTLIGTTDIDFAGDLVNIAITEHETAYLCDAASQYFANPIAPADVIWSYSGVRSLQDDGQSSAQDTSRDFVFDVDASEGAPPLLSVVGGKITTYRRVSEEALRLLASAFPGAGPAWTEGVPLPGGDFAGKSREELVREFAAECPPLGLAHADRIIRAYGVMARDIFSGVARRDDLGAHFGAGLYEREVVHLMDSEWATSAEDILWRRTKLGLHMSNAERRALSQWISDRASCRPKPDLSRMSEG